MQALTISFSFTSSSCRPVSGLGATTQFSPPTRGSVTTFLILLASYLLFSLCLRSFIMPALGFPVIRLVSSARAWRWLFLISQDLDLAFMYSCSCFFKHNSRNSSLHFLQWIWMRPLLLLSLSICLQDMFIPFFFS